MRLPEESRHDKESVCKDFGHWSITSRPDKCQVTGASLTPLSHFHKSPQTNMLYFYNLLHLYRSFVHAHFMHREKLILILIMSQNQYWTANYRSDYLMIITLHHVNSILICLAFYSNQDMIIKLTFIKSTAFPPF